MPFHLAVFAVAFFAALLTYLFGSLTGQHSELWRRLPRHQLTGAILALLVLGWAAYHVLPMLEGGLGRFRLLVILAVPVITVLAHQHLDFLLVRALGGLLLLTTSWLRHAAFVEDLPGRAPFTVLCYLVAIAGMIIVMAPWRFRDLLEQAGQSRAWRRGSAAIFAVVAVAFAGFALLAMLTSR